MRPDEVSLFGSVPVISAVSRGPGHNLESSDDLVRRHDSVDREDTCVVPADVVPA